MTSISQFMEKHFKHFNARETLDAARAWNSLLDAGGQMFLTLAGAMSTAEIGISLSQMIRQGKVHGICCTAANLEEDLFNLFNNREYELVPHYKDLTPQQEAELRDRQLNRVTDTCIPETVMHQVEKILYDMWRDAAEQGTAKYPWEYFYDLLDLSDVEDHFQVDREHSWVLAAKEMGLPIYAPGWADSTMGNKYTALIMEGKIKHHHAVRTGTEQLEHLANWYLQRVEADVPVGFFQIGGGIAGDFPICVVPMIIQDLKKPIPYWAYFCQISDSTTSYGSYSGAVPNEKITWGKLDVATPKYMINSDASIVAPLIFAYVLGQ
ncbi:MAG: deoxyhypusine synthase [Desulfovibrio sp.]|nr:MAG: deoxyhypusine synthase [Desulfovibrio sp.]